MNDNKNRLKKLSRYSTLAKHSTVAAVACAMTEEAAAVEVTYDLNKNLPGSSSNLWVDFVAGNTSIKSLSSTSLSSFHFGARGYGGSGGTLRIVLSTAKQFGVTPNFVDYSSTVDQNGSFNQPGMGYSTTFDFYSFNTGETKLVGFRFTINNDPDPSTTHYGWASFTNNGDAIVLNRISYESIPDQGIHPDPIPEPSVGLFALAAGSLGAFRRRRKSA